MNGLRNKGFFFAGILLFFPTKNMWEKNVEFYFIFNFLTRGGIQVNFAPTFFPHVPHFFFHMLKKFVGKI
jgi:hypothetical protein